MDTVCGRFAVTTAPARLAGLLGAVDETRVAGFEPNYNVAPTTEVAAVVAEGRRRIRLMRWGLLPAWVKAGPDGRPAPARQLINARAETLTSSPAFRSAAAQRRCLVPMDGYYEWRPDADVPGRGRKTPFYVSAPDGSPLLVAGVWSRWRPGTGAAGLLSCTLVTTAAPPRFAAIHDRVPLVLAEADWDRWLDPESPAPAELLAAPAALDSLTAREVSTLVNSTANNGPDLIAPAGPGDQPVGLF